ncbi:MAG: hypothetical protein OXD39_14835 [Gemmatimonadetes bacterium]|nr:hypothetical protein [Gemmatimonadota bacterium]
MYILNIKALKHEINEGKVTDRFLLPYVIGYGVLVSIAVALNIAYTTWDHVANVLMILIAGPAYYYLYRSNKQNPEGSFLPNLLLMSWVCTFRFTIFFMVPLYVIMLIAGVLFVGEVEEYRQTTMDGSLSLVSVLFYILLVVYTARHIKSLRISSG